MDEINTKQQLIDNLDLIVDKLKKNKDIIIKLYPNGAVKIMYYAPIKCELIENSIK